MPLTELAIRALKPEAKDRKYADAGGLYLVVSAKGAKYWRWKYRYGGREKALSLGPWPTVSLKEARAEVSAARLQLRAGADPGALKAEAKAAARAPEDHMTFRAVADEWHRERQGSVSAHTWDKERSILDNDVLPWLGDRPAGAIEPPELLSVLRRVQARSVETAHRALAMCKFVFRLAVASGRAQRNPALDLVGILPTTRPTHRAAVTEPAEVGALLRRVWASKASFPVVVALRVLAYVFVRPGELIRMRWSELDLDGEHPEWRYRVSKTNVDHLVPLAPQVVALLRELQPLTGHREFVFVTRAGGEPISENTLNSALRACGVDTKAEHTGHGWRATARTLLAERLGFEPQVVEHQLAHAVPDALGRAYNRAFFLDQRRVMMVAYAEYLDKLRSEAATQ